MDTNREIRNVSDHVGRESPFPHRVEFVHGVPVADRDPSEVSPQGHRVRREDHHDG